MLSIPLSSIKFLDVMGDMVQLNDRLGVMGTNWELHVRSAGRDVSVSPD